MNTKDVIGLVFCGAMGIAWHFFTSYVSRHVSKICDDKKADKNMQKTKSLLLAEYAESLGWVRLHKSEKDGLVVLNNPRFEQRQLVFAKDESAPDYAESIDLAVEKLAFLEKKEKQSINFTIAQQSDVLCMLETARKADDVSKKMRTQLSLLAVEALEKLFPVGSEVDLSYAGAKAATMPACLLGAKVVSGNPRGTHLFRVAKIVSVDIKLHDLGMSKWEFEAVPISGVTGRDMKPGGRYERNRETVRIVSTLGGAAVQYGDMAENDQFGDVCFFNLLVLTSAP